jgi:hypothetical protein
MLGNKSINSWWRAVCACSVAGAVAALAVGCGSSTAPPPMAWVIATLFDGTSGSACMAGDNITWFSLEGGGTVSSPTGVANGATYEGGPASVGCTVAPSGNGFTVNGQITLNTGSFLVSGGSTITSSGTQSGLSASFSNSAGIEYADTSCTLTYTNFTNPPVKAGAVWGTLTCPNMTNGQPNNSCKGTIQMQLTNCTQ